MQALTDKSSYFDRAGTARELLLWVTGIVFILLSTAGFALMMGWGTSSTDDSWDILALDRTNPVPTSEARARPRCPECGVIVSMRGIERQDEDSDPGTAGGTTAGSRNGTPVKPAMRYEIIVRMADGSSRVIEEANPARWRTGERLMVIAGSNPSLQ